HNFRLAHPCWMGASGLHKIAFKNSLVSAGPVTRTITGPILGWATNSNVKKGATLPFCHNHFRYSRNPLAIAGNAESIPIREFLSLDHSRPKLGEERRRTLAQFC